MFSYSDLSKVPVPCYRALSLVYEFFFFFFCNYEIIKVMKSKHTAADFYGLDI